MTDEAPRPAPPARRLTRAFAGLLARALGVVHEVTGSPLVELDLRELLASWRTGALAGLLTLALGIAALVAAWLSTDAPFRATILRFGMGHYLVLAAQLAIAGVLTLAVPVRALGLIEGPRWRGFFDQIVTSGLSPSAYYLGRALSAQGLIALVFATTAPLVLALGLADPPAWRTVLANHALLLVYAELLLATTLGLGALVHESIAAVLTIGVGAGLGLLSLVPVPTALVALSPVRAIGGTLFAAATTLAPAERDVFYGPPRLMGVELPPFAYEVALSLFAGALAASACFVGRPHSFAPGFDSFGTIVLKGDRRRAAILRFRPVLVRRSELAFFFENQGPRQARLAPWARLGRALGLLSLTTVLPLLALWDDSFLAILTTRDHMPFAFGLVAGVFGALAALAPLVFATSKNDAPLDLVLGRSRVPMVVGDVLAYAAFATGLFFLYEHMSEELVATSALSFAKAWGTPFQTKADVVEGCYEWARVLAVTGGALLLVQKIFGLRLNDAILGAVVAFLLVGATGFLLAAVDVSDLRAGETRVRGRGRARVVDEEKPEHTPEGNAASLAALHLCPIFRLRTVMDSTALEDIPLPPGWAYEWIAREGFWAIYPLLELLLFLATVELVRLRRREARAALAESLAPEPAKPAVPA